MRLLLDTHALVFLLSEPERLTRAAREAIGDPANDVAFSAVNVWEVEIKAALGKLVPPAEDTLAAARSLPLGELAMTADHARAAGRLPAHHRDPFDRALIAQARVEGLTVVTRDGAFEPYDVAVLPC